jgi:mono/diheme cytochrome c family protein
MKTLLSIGMLAILATAALAAQAREPRPDPNAGPYLYRIHCASCHGTGGRGDGVVAMTLPQAPPDLTTIAERRGGIYPSAEVAGIIDGRKPLAAHTRNGMPLWGAVFGTLELRNEAAVKSRIAALVTYLESIQRTR